MPSPYERQRPRATVGQAVAQCYDQGFARWKGVDHAAQFLAERLRLEQSECLLSAVRIDDEIADLGVPVVSDRCFQTHHGQ